MRPKYWNKAKIFLSENDPVMRKIISQYKGEYLASRGNSFETLARSIVGQQISVKAAASVWTKFEKLVVEVTPENVAKAAVPELRSCGLSERKVEYCKDLADHFISGKLKPHTWAALDDEALIELLIDVRGIGRWTAEMFLMFHLLRPNVLPVDDLGLQKAVSKAYKKRYPMSKTVLVKVAKNWEPYRSVATWYLWRSLDPIPVEY